MKLSNAAVTEFRDGAGPLQFSEEAKALFAHAAGPGARQSAAPAAEPLFRAGSTTEPPANNPQPARQTRPARNLPKFCVYPLGIVRKRSYDGGLSFLAQMQIGVEGGV
ncbi:hypothetical protein [Burkholderia cenocepacia]|uniref:hypothetical protein n=1 Tax=Burkholderia cenocepacia TaxID=95486 RepID=UPI002AB13218|nr:hypothetical protein [Burkholderia cenocepacia]